MKKISRRNFLKVSGAMAAAGALAACGGSGASTPAASGAASTSTAASAAAAGEDKFASLGDFTMTVGHAQPEGNPRFVSMPIIEIFKGAAPYVICNVIVLISISLWGPLTTALPQLLGYSIF